MLLVLPGAFTWARAEAPQGDNGSSATQALTFDGDTALWTMAIKADKTTDFENVMKKLRDAFAQSPDPKRQQQAAGWRVMKIGKPLPDGTVAYVHIIHPVVAGADYTIMKALYDAFPNERQTLYEQYRGAFEKNLSLATGSVVVDLAKNSAN
jgi:hypothetical protein